MKGAVNLICTIYFQQFTAMKFSKKYAEMCSKVNCRGQTELKRFGHFMWIC